MAVDTDKAFEVVGIQTVPKFVEVQATLASGLVTITAADVGLRRIKGFMGSVWGATAVDGWGVSATTAFDANGVTSLALQAVEDGVIGGTEKITVLLWGDK